MTFKRSIATAYIETLKPTDSNAKAQEFSLEWFKKIISNSYKKRNFKLSFGGTISNLFWVTNLRKKIIQLVD